ncbi:Lymphocyte transmembrane adapter 1 [Trebouxia sp. C0010 RCD-2024]
MLALPNAMANTGIRAGVPLLFVYSIFSMFTIHLLTALYAEYKARKVKTGKWEGGHDKKATQYFDVITDLVGYWPGRFVLLITIISLCSTGIAQVVACSTGAYYLNTSITKRTWTLIFGAALSGTMTFIPTFRHFRIYNIISLTGTAYSAVYLIVAATCKLNGADEVIDAMFQPSKYDTVYPFSYLYTYFVSTPHSILIQLANPTANREFGNVYGVVPVSAARDVSIVLMIIHQFVAYALYVTPVFFMWEKLVGTHQKPLWIRLPSRLPVSLFVWFIALLLPFYNTINAIMGSFGNSFTAFVFPAGAYLWVYGRSAEARANAPKQPFLPGGWATQLTLCVFLFIWFLVFGVGFGMWASILNLVQNVNTYSAFAECYQCAGIIKTNQLNG